MAKRTIKIKVRILSHLSGVYSKYQPTVGEIYDAEYKKATQRKGGRYYAPVCFIEVLDKKICLRRGEYEIVEEIK
jgi:hypothetical protein